MTLAPLLVASLLSAAPAATEKPAGAPAALVAAGNTARPPASISSKRPGKAQVVAASGPACAPLARPRSGPPPFPAGELLGYDVDVTGVRAATMSFEVLPKVGRGSKAEIPVKVELETNTFFNKVRKVKAEVLTRLRAKDLHPTRFHEEAYENDKMRVADVEFSHEKKNVQIAWRSSSRTGSARAEMRGDALDYVGAIYLFRSVPLKIGETFCFEVYAMRRMWRLEGKVEAREHVSTPAGEFEAMHLSGTATRLGAGTPLQREVHVWISDDERRLPLAALGVIDLGAVRAVLSSVQRADFTSAPARPDKLEW